MTEPFYTSEAQVEKVKGVTRRGRLAAHRAQPLRQTARYRL